MKQKTIEEMMELIKRYPTKPKKMSRNSHDEWMLENDCETIGETECQKP
jgi:hypothetical protein